MQCRDVIELADSFVADELFVETTHDILRHQAQCARCRAEIEDRRQVRAALRAAFEKSAALRPQPKFLASISGRIRSLERSRRRTAWRWRAVLAVAAGVFLAVVAFVARERLETQKLAALARAAVGDHRNCALKFQLAERPTSLEEAGRRFNPAYARLATVEPVGDRLSRGPIAVVERHSCVFNGRRFAHIVLSYGGDVVSVLVAIDTASGTPPAVLSIDGHRVAALRMSRFAIFVVSPFSEEETRRLAASIRAPFERALAGA